MPASILLISPYPADHVSLGSILPGEQWQMRHALSWREAERLLDSTAFTAIITEASLDGRCWQDLLDRIQDTPVIVTSVTADDQLWSEVLNRGGYNVLAKPFEAGEVSWVLRNATRQKGPKAGRKTRSVNASC